MKESDINRSNESNGCESSFRADGPAVYSGRQSWQAQFPAL
jgi:hypothetical protein